MNSHNRPKFTRRRDGSRPLSRPYDPTLDPLLARWAAQKNLDLADVAHQIGIPVALLRQWLRDHPELSAAVTEGHRTADAKVIEALYKRATGYDYENSERLVTKHKVKGQTTETQTARKTQHHLPPDTRAILFWLKNRRPDQWSDTPDTNPSTETIIRLRPVPWTQIAQSQNKLLP
jgi:hypothetical protein